jgi:precorrin-8X/cobalt-precorrin-8 methylmutase
MTDLVADIGFSAGVYDAAFGALHAGAPIFCDAHMVASGITRARLPRDNEVICTLRSAGIAERAAALGTTRSAAAVELWGDRLEGAVVAIGNAPTALFHLLSLVGAGGPRPAAVLGIPVGFIGAAESKAALADSDLEHLVVHGRRGGSAIVAAAVNALATVVE